MRVILDLLGRVFFDRGLLVIVGTRIFNNQGVPGSGITKIVFLVLGVNLGAFAAI